MYYFAYGSCMNKKDFERTLSRISYRILGRGMLNNYKLAYNAYSSSRNGGVLDIEESNGHYVVGVLYELPEEAIRQIDQREGIKYKRIVITVECEGKVFQAFTYVIKEKTPTRANISYSGIVYYAMLDNKFPEAHINDFIRLVRISAYGSEEAYFNYKAAKQQRSNHG